MPGSTEPRVLVLGIGNLLMADEGVGVHAIRQLEGMQIPEGVDLLDGGVGGFHLLEAMQKASRIVLIDATIDGNPPGSICRLRPEYSSDYPKTLTAHDVGFKDLLDTFYLTGRARPDVTLFTVSIETLPEGLSVDLTPAVKRCMDDLCRQVVAELQSPSIVS